MVKSLALLLLSGTLAACGSTPKADATPAPSEPQKGCYQGRLAGRNQPGAEQALGSGRPGQIRDANPGQGTWLSLTGLTL
ncbi:hypothetical protein QE391_004915 [Pseudomonas fluorescens]|nr:hypothetical protein [Pseudomonas fluorescens]